MSLRTKKTRTLIFDYSTLLQKESVLYWREGLEVSVTTKVKFQLNILLLSYTHKS